LQEKLPIGDRIGYNFVKRSVCPTATLHRKQRTGARPLPEAARVKREAGANPARSRHCESGISLQDATVPPAGMGRREESTGPTARKPACSHSLKALRGKDRLNQDWTRARHGLSAPAACAPSRAGTARPPSLRLDLALIGWPPVSRRKQGVFFPCGAFGSAHEAGSPGADRRIRCECRRGKNSC